MRKAALFALALALAFPALAAAQNYPSKPIRIVVPLPPGSNGDLMPRILGQHLSVKLGQPVVIENRSGAAQNLGAEYVSRAEPDGYTLLATPQGPLVISPSFYPNLPFDPSQFVPITIMAKLPYILVVHPKVPVEHVCGVHRLRQGQPGQAQLRHAGAGLQLASDRRDAEARGRHPDDARALCGARARHHRSPGRPHRRDDRQSRQRAGAGAGGQAQGPRRHQRDSARRSCPTCRRSRRPIPRWCRRAGSPWSRRRRRRRRSPTSCRAPSPRFCASRRSRRNGAR